MKEEKIYRVLEIYEADFGCEERPEGQETMVMVRLVQEKQDTLDREDKTEGAELREDKIWEEPEEYTMQVADAWLEAHKIEEGDLVCLSEGKLFPLGKQI